MQYYVIAVVVSYNRETLLDECLRAIGSQTRTPDLLIVVDNASTDGALAVARDFAAHGGIDTRIIPMRRNTGGAGGFAAGLDEALRAPAPAGTVPLAWLMDDDTVPTPDALAGLLRTADACAERNRCMPAALGSKAIWTDGREHLMNRPRPRQRPVKGARTLGDAYQVRSLSFVSCLVNLDAVRALGRLPRAAYFLWNDDYEYTTALLRDHAGYYVPGSVVVHKTRTFGSSDADPGERFYYEVRNKIWLWRFSRSNFGPVERVAFLLKSVRRWVLTWLRSSDRATIVDCLRRGWHDGWGSDPEPTDSILREAAPAAR